MGLKLHEAGEAGEAAEASNRAGSEVPGYLWSPGSMLGAERYNLLPKCKFTLFVCIL
jgi:hypothetical protein